MGDFPGNARCYDAVIIGGGVVGCAIARELSRFRLSIALLEAEEDVCCGTSKANSAILHAGFDAEPGTNKACFNVAGNAMMDRISEELSIPFSRIGSLVACRHDQNASLLNRLKEQGAANGVPGLEILKGNALRSMEPMLSPEVGAALYAPTGGIVCPFDMTFAFAENAAQNGVRFFMDHPVTGLERTPEERWLLIAGKEVFSARAVINAAGVFADHLHNMALAAAGRKGGRTLSITPRRGEYLLFDHEAGGHVSHTIFQLPGPMGKGVLVTPTVHGNLLAGPTAEDVEDREATQTTAKGLSDLKARAALCVKDLPFSGIITSFAGLRAHEQGGDFVIGEAEGAPFFFNAAGIESPGLSAAPAIARHLANEVAGALSAPENPGFDPRRKGFARLDALSSEAREKKVRENPEYGQIICRCEGISLGEIRDAIRCMPGARSLDGVKRRVRAGMGRCQSGFCSPRVMELLEQELSLSPSALTKSGAGSFLLTGRTKET